MNSLSEEELRNIDAYWRAANYLSVGQIYLLDNPLLREPLRAEHIKPRLLGHWGTSPGLNLIYAHLNRVIRLRNLDTIFITGPGHGGPAVVANTYLEGTYTELFPEVSEDLAGLRRLCRQFSFPGGIPSHAAPETPGSIHEGGELGYALSHAYGAAFDNPDLLVACVIGDGEAETGPLAASWHSNKFLDPVTSGAVLPILHLNGYKIANPTVLARIPRGELEALLTGYGHRPIFVEGDEPREVHQALAAALDQAVAEIREVQDSARRRGVRSRPRWPAIVLRTPKGWTGPKEVDGQRTEGHWRSHQVPLSEMAGRPEHLKVLNTGSRATAPRNCSTKTAGSVRSSASWRPRAPGAWAPTRTPTAGCCASRCVCPTIGSFAVEVPAPGIGVAEATRVTGRFLQEVMRLNLPTRNFRVFGPDEIMSNRLGDVLSVTDRAWVAEVKPDDDHLAPGGMVMEILSEHTCQGWLEGYLLTGRHGLFTTYEAFAHIIDSMFNQHAKWLKVARGIPWRAPIASLTYLLSSHVWRQDNNGFSHQDPGFIDHVVNKKADVIRVYLPPDANTSLSVMDHCLRSRNYVNVILAGKQPALQFLDMDAAVKHCTRRDRHLGMGQQRSWRRA